VISRASAVPRNVGHPFARDLVRLHFLQPPPSAGTARLLRRPFAAQRAEEDFMARYDDEYTTRARRPGRGRWSAARRPRGRRRPARAGRRWSPPGPAYGEEYIIRSRMGMHDFGEHYGRYSGGSPYS